jgi:hypothetical protein
MSVYNTQLNTDVSEVLANKNRFITSEEIYQNIYIGQLLEISKLSISFLFSSLLIKLLDNALFSYFIKYPRLYSILLIFMLICIILLAGSVFTYIKIVNEKDDFLDKLVK